MSSQQMRGHAKAAITRAASFCETLDETVDIELLETRLAKLEIAWKEFSCYHSSCLEGLEDAAVTTLEEEFGEYEDKHCRAYAKITKLLREKQGAQKQTQLFEQLAEQQSAFLNKVNASGSSSKNVSLPKISIAPFSGNYKDWPTFRDMFIDSVDTNDNLSSTQKFHFLKSFLKDEAADLISHIPPTEANYLGAWDKLEKRYNRVHLLVHSLIQSFISLPSMSSSNSGTLRKITDGADEVIRGLEAAKKTGRDPWLIFLLLNKLDDETRHAWAMEVGSRDDCSVQELIDFLELRCDAFESCQPMNSSGTSRKKQPVSIRTHLAESREQNNLKCLKCKGDHSLSQCSSFIGLSIESRRTFAKENSLCFNCLRSGHASYRCYRHSRCRVCKSRHHTLVHSNHSGASQSSPKPSSDLPADYQKPLSFTVNPGSSSTSPMSSHHSLDLNLRKQTILPTVLAKIQDCQGQLIDCRVLLDTGSQSSFITEALAQRLGLRRKHSRIPIIGLSSKEAGHTNGSLSVCLVSRFNDVHLRCETHILGKLTTNLPAYSFDISSLSYIQALNLADPQFNVSSSVDVLLGADRVWSILRAEQICGPEGKPLAQNTSFGWVISGEFIDSHLSSAGLCNLHSAVDVDFLLQRFWELDEVPSITDQTNNDPAESLFRESVSRSEDGRYVVPLLLKTPLPTFGNTLGAAISRLHSMERRFQRNPELRQLYGQFMEEYLSLKHMELIPENEVGSSGGKNFYLPHHAVLKPDSSSTKLRVVFDGSAGDSLGQSLNSYLYIGPPIQRDLIGVCLRFRQHRFVFTADIIKMFRQILIREHETDYQRIVWRTSPNEAIRHYRLRTVTYGTASAPFLAVRALKQLADDYRMKYPIAARIISNDVYVDDIMTGADTIDDLLKMQSELIELLSLAKIQLRKWSSNCWALLATLPAADCEYSFVESESSSSLVKILGMLWNPSSDVFSFRCNQPVLKHSLTRRTLLSEVAKIFDPLGFLAPSVILFKIMFQELWASELKLGWDDPLPEKTSSLWMNYRKELPLLQNIRVPRNIFPGDDVELHGFSDASSLAYAAVVYARSKTGFGEVKVTLVAAKTKVAPLKPLSIPRLELCGALLLSKLFKLVKSSLNTDPKIKITAWCDSEIVLHWLSSPPRRWATFVANRTSAILEMVPIQSWKHIASECNPADCASRGIVPSQLVNHSLWWTGPSWLSETQEHWPISPWANKSVLDDTDPVKRETRRTPKTVMVSSPNSDIIQNLIDKISSWHRLIRIFAWCYRFISNSRIKKEDSELRVCGGLKFNEIHSAKIDILKYVQRISYPKDINDLLSKKSLSSNSLLLRYSAFLDSTGLLRVGGRIKHAAVSYSIKHPIILPKSNKISFLIVQDVHLRYAHAGVSETFTFVRQQYWIMGSRNIVRKVIHICKPCFMQRKSTCKQLMGDLPLHRIQPNRPFTDTGCDYAGPLTIKLSRGRKPKLLKAYIALFVCFSTKAIHLEVVSDLTTDAFLAALRRFVSRRGLCRNIYSDNGTNFQGARRCLSEMHKLVLSQTHNDAIVSSLAKDGIAWHFIPPSAPHFGGLWEAGVKSVKLHLRRVIGSSILTFEELATVTSQIEAILNSRPLSCLSDTDLNPLTPSHFLIGEPMTAVPEPSQLLTPVNHLSHWNHLQAMVQGFWRRWHTEYLTTLQERPKWQRQQTNLKPGDVVVVKEPSLPPAKWLLGRIEAVTPGADQLVRVATVKTTTGTFNRPVSKLAILPLS